MERTRSTLEGSPPRAQREEPPAPSRTPAALVLPVYDAERAANARRNCARDLIEAQLEQLQAHVVVLPEVVLIVGLKSGVLVVLPVVVLHVVRKSRSELTLENDGLPELRVVTATNAPIEHTVCRSHTAPAARTLPWDC
jgi:hypothetical protein